MLVLPLVLVLVLLQLLVLANESPTGRRGVCERCATENEHF